MAITNATIYSSVFSDVRTTIVAAAPVVTNSSTSATSAASINAAYNDKYTTKPQIIINPVDKEESNFKFGSNEGRKFLNVMVECYYQNTAGVDQLAEQVEAAIKDTNFGGMELVGITSDYAFTNPNDSKYHMKTITFTFDRE